MSYKAFCEKIAKESGKIIKENFSRPMQKEWKEDATPVTITDRDVNKLVIDAVHKEFPGHDVKGEEECSLEHDSDHVWVCDPVDGTIPFSHGIPTAAFYLGLVIKGETVAGVIYDPWIDRLYFAEKGKGCFLNGQKIHVNDSKDFKLSLMGMAMWKNPPYEIADLNPILTEKGVCMLDLCSIVYMGMLVASGELSAVFFAGGTGHDGAALKVIIEEAGGKMTDLYGNEQRYDENIKGFIVSNGVLHDELLKIVSDILK